MLLPVRGFEVKPLRGGISAQVACGQPRSNEIWNGTARYADAPMEMETAGSDPPRRAVTFKHKTVARSITVLSNRQSASAVPAAKSSPKTRRSVPLEYCRSEES